ncbi:MAG: hypothetical protein P8M80_00905 [Pirellulaceae bacterium]|nr:hypothetical protein [Pirellulaceae bacterium]
MPIKFHCPECYAEIITADETAGKQGRCSNCTVVVHIPLRNPAAAGIVRPETSSTQPSVQPDRSSQRSNPVVSGDPFKPTVQKSTTAKNALVEKQLGMDQWDKKLEDGSWGEDTALSLKMRGLVAQERTKHRIMGPAQALSVTAAVNLIGVAISIVSLIAYVVYQAQTAADINVTLVAIWMMATAVVMLCSMMIAIGANHMKLTRSYSMAYTGVVFSLLPLNPLFFLTIPFGVWALRVLNDIDIGSGFKRP